MAKESRITKVTLELQDTGMWSVVILKEFDESHGGGTQEFKLEAGDLRSAWEMWRGFIHIIPAFRTCETCHNPVTVFGCQDGCKKPEGATASETVVEEVQPRSHMLEPPH